MAPRPPGQRGGVSLIKNRKLNNISLIYCTSTPYLGWEVEDALPTARTELLLKNYDFQRPEGITKALNLPGLALLSAFDLYLSLI